MITRVLGAPLKFTPKVSAAFASPTHGSLSVVISETQVELCVEAMVRTQLCFQLPLWVSVFSLHLPWFPVRCKGKSKELQPCHRCTTKFNQGLNWSDWSLYWYMLDRGTRWAIYWRVHEAGGRTFFKWEEENVT